MIRGGSWLRAFCAGGVLVATSSCGGGTTLPAAPTQASITVTVSPNPVTARRCNPLCLAPSGTRFPFEAAMSVSVQESAHISGDVNFINVTPVTSDGTELPMLGYGSDVLVQRSTTNHVTASGIFTFYLAFFYATGADNPVLVVNISLQFTDDKGNVLTGTASVNVADPSPPASDTGSSLRGSSRSLIADEAK